MQIARLYNSRQLGCSWARSSVAFGRKEVIHDQSDCVQRSQSRNCVVSDLSVGKTSSEVSEAFFTVGQCVAVRFRFLQRCVSQLGIGGIIACGEAVFQTDCFNPLPVNISAEVRVSIDAHSFFVIA